MQKMRQGDWFQTSFYFLNMLNMKRNNWSAAYFQYISIVLNLRFNKHKLYKTLDYWSRDILSFNFPEKGLGLVSPPYFVYYFSRKMFFMLYSINWPNFIVWLALLLEILGNICITIVCQKDCDVIKFEINLSFLTSCFVTWPTIQDKNLNI